MSICILVPSRGRPDRAQAMAESVRETATEPVLVTLIIDPDDPTLPEYQRRFPWPGGRTQLEVGPRRLRFTEALNAYASGDPSTSRGTYPFWDDFTILGAFGDDVLFRTPGWDQIVEETLATPGLAYGDDLIHGKNHPSAVFMSSSIAKALGWLALPAVWHTWADDAWKRIGQETGLLRYMPEVIVEHMHYGVGKSEEDDTYRSAYSKETGDHDYPAFAAWLENGLAEDVAKVRAVA